MINSIKKRTPGFQKGECGNPKGRPVGAYCERKKQYVELQRIASGKAQEMFVILENAMRTGESWAHQIYWKELFHIPKRYLEETTSPIIPKGDALNIDERVKAYTQALDRFEDFTRDEVLTALKVLNSIKSNEVVENQAEHVRLTREELGHKIENYVKAMDYMEKENNEEK